MVTLAGGGGAGVSGPPAEMVFGDWYPALRVGGLKAGKTAKAMLLGIPVLVGRKRDGAVFATAGPVSASGDSAVGGVV